MKEEIQIYIRQGNKLVKKKHNFRNIISIFVDFLFMLLNIGGTIVWIYIYNSGRLTHWGIFIIIPICGLAALIYAVKVIQDFKNFR